MGVSSPSASADRTSEHFIRYFCLLAVLAVDDSFQVIYTRRPAAEGNRAHQTRELPIYTGVLEAKYCEECAPQILLTTMPIRSSIFRRTNARTCARRDSR